MVSATRKRTVLSGAKKIVHRVKQTARAARVRLNPPPSELRLTPESPILRALKKERARLTEEIRQQEIIAQDHPSTGNHMADDATDLFEQEKGLALKRHLERMLEQVDAAVARAEKGTYGVCEKCGQPIDPERLKALPAATLCLADAQAETKKRVAA